MESIVSNVLNEMPVEPVGNYRVYSSKNLVVFNPEILFCGHASFGCYQFVMPLSDFPEVFIDKKVLIPKKDHIFTVKPFQNHGILVNNNIESYYYAIFINKAYMEELSYNVTGKIEFVFDEIYFKVNSKLKSLIKCFIEEAAEKQKGYEFILENIANEISVNLIRLFNAGDIGSSPTIAHGDRKNINKVIDFLRENYNSNYSTDEVAKIANLSPYHFIRVFKSETGKTPYEYLLSIKINSAMKMLKDKNLSITEICYQSGFSNLSHFTTAFKKHTGMTPSQYRHNIKGGSF